MRRVRLLLLLSGMLTACGTTPYERYAQTHPGWNPEFPRLGIDLEETVASVFAPPPRKGRNKLMANHRMDIFRTDADPWQKIRSSKVEGMDARDDYLVIVHSSCDYSSANYYHSYSSSAWYYLAQGELQSYGHWRLGEFCSGMREREGVEDLPLPVRSRLEGSGFLDSTLPSE